MVVEGQNSGQPALTIFIMNGTERTKFSWGENFHLQVGCINSFKTLCFLLFTFVFFRVLCFFSETAHSVSVFEYFVLTQSFVTLVKLTPPKNYISVKSPDQVYYV